MTSCKYIKIYKAFGVLVNKCLGLKDEAFVKKINPQKRIQLLIVCVKSCDITIVTV